MLSTVPPFQLLAQHLEVAPRRRPDQPQHALGAADADVVVRLQLKSGLTVERDVHFVAFLHQGLHAHRRGRRDDNRAVGERVRRNRRQQQRVDVGCTIGPPAARL